MDQPLPLPYSNPDREGQIFVQHLPDGVLEIDVPPPGLSRTLNMGGRSAVPLVAFVAICMLAPAGWPLCKFVRTRELAWLLATVGAVVLTGVVVAVIGVLTCAQSTRRVVVRCAVDWLEIEQTARGQDRFCRRWSSGEIVAIDVGLVDVADERRSALRVHLRTEMRHFLSDRTAAELAQVLALVRQVIGLDASG